MMYAPGDTGGPAFPTANGGSPDDGMTLRDYFAAKAMQSILGVLHEGIRPSDISRMCADCYGIADAMLKERAK